MKTYLELLDEWKTVKQQMASLKTREMDLRKLLVAGAFPTPKEGTNRITLIDGQQLILKHTIQRNVDRQVLPTIRNQLRNFDELFDFKPDLNVKPYRALTEAERNIVDKALIINPGSPQLEVEDGR